MPTPTYELSDLIDGVIFDIKNDVNNPNRKYSPKETKSLLESIVSRYSELSQYLAVQVPEEILREYGVGMNEAGTLIKAQGIGTVTGSLKGKVHLEAVSELATNTVLDLQSAIRTASLNGVSNIQDSLKETQDLMAKGLLAGNTRKQTQKRVASSFEQSGLTSFITRDGKKLPLDFYAQTVVRTKTKMANVQGAVNRYLENGIEFVQVSKHGATCAECAKREGLILSLTGETAGVPKASDVGLPPYHPNCRHSVKPIVSLEGRTVKPFMPNSDARSVTQKDNYGTEQKIRRRANVEKKDYMRMVAELGDDAPKTIGAYRRMKRKNDDVWKGLQAKFKESTNLLRSTEAIKPANQFNFVGDDVSITDVIARWRENNSPKGSKPFNPIETKLYKDMQDKMYKGNSIDFLLEATDWDNETYMEFKRDESRFFDPSYVMYWEPEGVEKFFGKGQTLEGIANTFNPDPSQFKVRFSRFQIGTDDFKIDMEIQDLDGEHVGSIGREFHDFGDEIVVMNNILELQSEYQGSNFATNIYFKSEQFYKQIANGKKIRISTTANLDVGVYAWTKHGFDFAKEKDLIRARSNLKDIIKESLYDRRKAGEFGDVTEDAFDFLEEDLIIKELQKMGYNSMEEIKHTWQFASLDNGELFFLGNGINVNGQASIGKYLFLDRMGEWKGIKKLNSGDVSEEISNLYYEQKGIK